MMLHCTNAAALSV